MMKTVVTLAVAIALCVGVVVAGAGSKDKIKYEQPLIETGTVQEIPSKPMPHDDWSMTKPLVGTFTTLTGWYDFQSNGGSIQQIRVNPANGNIHVTWMTCFDSTLANTADARRVGYAFSTNGGANWNNFNSLYLPANRKAGFPSIDLGRGSIAGAAVIANHNVLNLANGNESVVYVDFPEGGGAFGEISPPPVIAGSLQPIWPYVAGASDGSVVVAASGNSTTQGLAHYSRTADFVSWSPWTHVTQVALNGGRYPVQSNGTGRVGIVYNTSNGTANLANWWLESTNNGQTWSTPVNIFDYRYDPVVVDSMNSYVHTDFVYNGNTPLFVFSEYSRLTTSNREDIVFWSQATGFKVAAPYDSLRYGPYNLTNPNPQRFHNLLTNFPSIGLSGSTIVVAYQAFQPDTDHFGFNYSDLWYVASSNGGNTWGTPQRITNTPTTDERYPSVSKWNAPGQFNIVWTQKPPGHSGLYAFPGPDGARGVDTVRTYQVFDRINPIQFTTSVEGGGSGVPSSFRIDQNYPNPFNPATKIDYVVARAGRVSIKVYSVLGEEVATLLNEDLQPGTYQTSFDGARLASGIYYYRMTAGSFTETKKMMLVK